MFRRCAIPKYQLVFDSTRVLADDEFEEIIRPFIESNPDFTFKFAINLEGIKKEFWEKKEQMVENMWAEDLNAGKIESTFDELSDLFKLDE